MTTVIEHVRIITGCGDILENAFFAYSDGIITAICPDKISGDHVINGTGKTLIPGLFDCHVHLGMEVPGETEPQFTEDHTLLGARIMKQCMEFPRYGVTTIRNMATNGDADILVKKILEENDLPAVRILASGAGISITGGHGGLHDGFDSADEVLKETRKRIKAGADVIKFVVTGGMGTKASKPGALQYTAEELLPAVEEAKICGKITGAHCTSLEGAREAVLAGIRSIEHAQLDEETADLIAQTIQSGNEIFYCPTLIARYSIIHNKDSRFSWLKNKATPGDMERKKKAVRLCKERNIPICASTDTNSPFVHVGDILKELKLYTECGLTEMEVIQTATRNASRLCMIDHLTGTLEVGKQADFAILSANPLENIENLDKVELTCRGGTVLYYGENGQIGR